ncbi:transcription factor bHLH94 [Musa acuminata AAA Group]|uniref:transcription factor bHLH94 n=1 Tax=Musa acuminata AAA Group TaxID=214697 RepID=UPI0031D35F26
MALEAAAFQHGFAMKEIHNLGGAAWRYDFGAGPLQEEEKRVLIECEIGGGGGGEGREVVDGKRGCNWDTCCSTIAQNPDDWDVKPSSPGPKKTGEELGAAAVFQEAVAGRRKRRRVKRFKNKEEVENQRMTHIAVERNRRKLMNEYLAVLRSLMPASYAQRGDQASIVGGAINFVKELEHLVQSLEARKRIRGRSQAAPFADFFTFPQYSSSPSSTASDGSTGDAVADIEVTIFESHANIKIFSRWRPRQLLELVLGLQGLRLTTLHLNVTTVDEMVLYCFSLKVEDDCQCTSVDVIATAVHQIIVRVEEEAAQN